MPPFLPRKRSAPSSPPVFRGSSTPRKRAKLNDLLDAEPGQSSDLQAAKNFSLGGDDAESSLSDLDSDEFEDVPTTRKTSCEKDEREQGHDEDVDWEDAMIEPAPVKENHVPMAGGNLELNLSRNLEDLDNYESVRAGMATKKGPTKIEREIRLQTHCMHVQVLLYHNAIRNRWTCNKEVQDILVNQLPPGIVNEIRKWRVSSGLETAHDERSKDTPSKPKGKKKGKRSAAEDERSQRDWGKPSTRLENGKPDLSRGDPIIPLLKILAAYWRKRFSTTAPGLRKTGYASAAARQRLIRSSQNDRHDPQKHGERVANLSAFRMLAKRGEGSRDVGAQLFTALLRGIGIDSRLVSSLQPSGFGWTKNEQAEIKGPTKSTEHEDKHSSSDLSEVENRLGTNKPGASDTAKNKGQAKGKCKAGNTKGKGISKDPVDLESLGEDDSAFSESGDASVIDVTPETPARRPSKYDRDLPFPIYWTEVISPISSVVIPVSPLVLANPVASTPEMLSTFEPRGAKADKAKLVMAYVVAHSSDGSAKDVTTRYLKRHMWPGKTKGVRMPIEKMPIYDKRGKIIRHEEYDWFKCVMSGYVRTDQMRTAVDDVEESTDLVPQQPERKESKQEGDTLQSLKSSAEFVLERFLRREEALRPSAKPVRTFETGKGDNLKEENVYLRADVERCLSAESWHKEGRQIKEGEAPMKLVPIRAVTLTRKREVEEMQRQTGEKPTQGLYCRDQTEYINPPPIKDGVIPRNSYGNIDCFVPSMVPRGAVHIPMRGTMRICKKLEIDYAEAVTGFEFGKKLAIPVVEGVVVAEEHEAAVRAGWTEYAEQQRVKEEGKLEKAVLSLWKRMLMGLRIRERVSDTYGEDVDGSGVISNHGNRPGLLRDALPSQDGFEDPVNASVDDLQDGGGFLLPHEGADNADSLGEIFVEHHGKDSQRKHEAVTQYPTPVSITSANVNRSSRKPKLLVEESDSSELSTAETIDDELDDEIDDEVKYTRTAKSSAAYLAGTAHTTLEIPDQNRPATEKQSRALDAIPADEQPLLSAVTSRDEKSNEKSNASQITSIQPPKPSQTKSKKNRVSPIASEAFSTSRLASPKRKQQPSRRASRKAALTSPYFDADANTDGDEDGVG